MRHLWLGTFASLLLAGLAVAEEACKSHGTAINFVDTPSEAARLAKKQGKLVLVLHVSGVFEDPRFT